VIKDIIDLKYPHIAKAFGGIDNFLNSIKRESYNAEYALAKTRTYVSVIYPWDLVINLDQVKDSYLYKPLSNQPYSIYTLNGELLYQVSEHNNIFGRSILDKTLTMSSKHGDMYYLDYSTLLGNIQVLLVINTIPPNISIDNSIDSDLLPQANTNRIVVSANTVYMGIGLTELPYNIYYLKESPSLNPSLLTVINKGDLTIERESPFLITPDESGWLSITQKVGVIDQPLFITTTGGAGTDRVVESNVSGVYYIAVGNSISESVLRQNSLTTNWLPLFTSNGSINISIELNNS